MRNMLPSEKIDAVMVANFDSTEQLAVWNALCGEQREIISWNKADEDYPVLLINRIPAFSTYFAGVARTAYLYRKRLVVTVPEVFDGIFSWLLGRSASTAFSGARITTNQSLQS